MPEHFKDFVDHIISDDESELGRTKAELAYALHSLEREIGICARTQAQNDMLVKALEDCLREHGGFTIRGECERNAREALRNSTPSPRASSTVRE